MPAFHVHVVIIDLLRTLSTVLVRKETEKELKMRKMCVWSLSNVTGSRCSAAHFLNANISGCPQVSNYL